VQIGSISGDAITLAGGALRSGGIELLGSGLGSLSSQQLLQSLRTMFAATAKVQFEIDIERVPLAKVEEAWTRKGDDRRIVFLP